MCHVFYGGGLRAYVLRLRALFYRVRSRANGPVPTCFGDWLWQAGLAIAVLFIGVQRRALSRKLVATIGALVVLSAIARMKLAYGVPAERVLLVGVGLGRHVPCSDDPASCQRPSTCSWPPELVFRFHNDNIGWNDAALVCICAIIVLLAALCFQAPTRHAFRSGDVTARAVGLKVSSEPCRSFFTLLQVLEQQRQRSLSGLSVSSVLWCAFCCPASGSSVTTRLLASALLAAAHFADWLRPLIWLIVTPCLQGCSHPSSGDFFSGYFPNQISQIKPSQ